jgi:hypothetical protein
MSHKEKRGCGGAEVIIFRGPIAAVTEEGDDDDYTVAAQ